MHFLFDNRNWKQQIFVATLGIYSCISCWKPRKTQENQWCLCIHKQTSPNRFIFFDNMAFSSQPLKLCSSPSERPFTGPQIYENEQNCACRYHSFCLLAIPIHWNFNMPWSAISWFFVQTGERIYLIYSHFSAITVKRWRVVTLLFYKKHNWKLCLVKITDNVDYYMYLVWSCEPFFHCLV